MAVVRVLVVDDSALVRQALFRLLSDDKEIEVVGMARDPYEARDLLVTLKPDVMTLDIEMPRMDGITFLKKVMRALPLPTLIVSSLAEEGKSITIQALEAGAVDIIKKPSLAVGTFFQEEAEDIRERVKVAAKARVGYLAPEAPTPSGRREKSGPVEKVRLEETTEKIIAIGASTGGVEALSRILPKFPATSPGIVIVQHMPQGYTRAFAERLNGLCAISVKEAVHDERVLPGQALIAPGGERHLEVVRVGGQYKTRLFEGERVCFNRPAVDVMFASVARNVGKNSVAVLMTGMGRDGALGLLEIKQAGGRTFAQDESSCVIYGMPAEAWAMGAAESQLPLEQIPASLLRAIQGK